MSTYLAGECEKKKSQLSERDLGNGALQRNLNKWVQFEQKQIWERGLPAEGPPSAQHGHFHVDKEHTGWEWYYMG